MQQSGMSTVRLSLVSFVIDAPGTYVLRIDGLDAGVDYSRCRIVFTRDTRAQLIGTIVATVLCAMGTIGTLVLSILSVTLR